MLGSAEICALLMDKVSWKSCLLRKIMSEQRNYSDK